MTTPLRVAGNAQRPTVDVLAPRSVVLVLRVTHDSIAGAPEAVGAAADWGPRPPRDDDVVAAANGGGCRKGLWGSGGGVN